MRFHLALVPLVTLLIALTSHAQEQIDKGDAAGKTAVSLADVNLRVRVTQATPAPPLIQIGWRRGGEGLGGTVERGAFASEEKNPELPLNTWTAAVPLADIVGKGKGTRFATIVATAPGKKAAPLTDVVVELEIAEKGKPPRIIKEAAPKGATVGLVVPAGGDRAAVLSGIECLSTYARHRYEVLEKKFAGPATRPSQFGVLGHLAGYGESTGYGIRHSNPQIVADECRTLQLLGMNGLVGEKSIKLADAAGVGKEFRRIYWGGPGSGSPMNKLTNGKEGVDACPFDPRLPPSMREHVAKTIDEYKSVGAQHGWGIWWDEIGVAAKEHIATCPRCREQFVSYLKSQKIQPAEVGAASWDDVKPYDIWQQPPAEAGAKGKPAKKGSGMAPAPASATDSLRYYYTFRFMTHATAQLFPESAKTLKQNNILLYAMQGPTPSWSGHSLDWHEFYDAAANTALVFETSNRDPRIWQWESYLGDIMRGISQRHDLPIGSLIKPHRGAPLQRMLSLVSRGVQNFEWYTYGPDYAKGDSFSQSPLLLEEVARAGRFLGMAEPYLYGAKPAMPAEVAFVSPRSSEIWGKAGEPGVAPFEDAKWVYLALRHAHIPVDILSEQQLAEGKLQQYKVIYVVGPNLRRDAGAKLTEWVKAGGTLWTDALGLARDEANQPATILKELFGLSERKLETWGTVEGYKATSITPMTGTAPANAGFHVIGPSSRPAAPLIPAIAREVLDVKSGTKIATYVDGSTAAVKLPVGRGEVIINGFWAGLTYSSKVRRPDFDMSADFDPVIRYAISRAALDKAPPPATTSSPLVEPVLLQKGGQRCITLTNWAYKHDAAAPQHAAKLQPVENLRVTLSLPGVKGVRSLIHGPLEAEQMEQGRVQVRLPRIDEVDVLIIE